MTLRAHSRSGEAEFLRRHLVELPIHQDVTAAQLDYVARETERLVPFSDRLQATLEAIDGLTRAA